MNTSEDNKQDDSFDKETEGIITNAAKNQDRHFAVGQPWRGGNESFKEANIAHALSIAFHQAGYYIFPEFPMICPSLRMGSIDSVFVRGREVFVCEWKNHCDDTATQDKIKKQTERMEIFNTAADSILTHHKFHGGPWCVHYLWVCEIWTKEEKDWWWDNFKDWTRGCYKFPGLKNDPRPALERWFKDGKLYWWVWAWK